MTLTAKFSDTGVLRFRDYEYNILDTVETSSVTNATALTSMTTGFNLRMPTDTSFEYWYDETVGDGANYFDGYPKEISGLVTLRPKLSGVYSVEFNSQGGSLVGAQSVKATSPYATEPEVPARTGYTFKHWALEVGGDTAFDFASAITKNTILYAVWEADKVGFRFSIYNEPNNTGNEYDPGTDRANYNASGVYPPITDKIVEVGTFLTSDEIDALVTEYLQYMYSYNAAIGPYLSEYVAGIGLQEEPFSPSGDTLVNIYFKRPLVKVTFDLNDAKVPEAANVVLTFNGQEYRKGDAPLVIYIKNGAILYYNNSNWPAITYDKVNYYGNYYYDTNNNRRA